MYSFYLSDNFHLINNEVSKTLKVKQTNQRGNHATLQNLMSGLKGTPFHPKAVDNPKVIVFVQLKLGNRERSIPHKPMKWVLLARQGHFPSTSKSMLVSRYTVPIPRYFLCISKSTLACWPFSLLPLL